MILCHAYCGKRLSIQLKWSSVSRNWKSVSPSSLFLKIHILNSPNYGASWQPGFLMSKTEAKLRLQAIVKAIITAKIKKSQHKEELGLQLHHCHDCQFIRINFSGCSADNNAFEWLHQFQMEPPRLLVKNNFVTQRKWKCPFFWISVKVFCNKNQKYDFY